MDSDGALRLLGRYSRWQITSYLCCASAFGVAFSWILMTVVFIADTPYYRCALPPNGTVEDWIPLVKKDGKYVYDQCSMYANRTVDNTTIPCKYGYWFDPENGYESTISMEWELVCDKAWLVELSMSMQAAGKIIGALVFNHISDKYGRKMVFLSCMWANVVIASVRAFSPNMSVYTVLVFIAGSVQQGMVSASFVMAVELFPTDQRSTAGTVIELFWALGYLTVGGMAYGMRNWRHLELATALPFIITIAYYWVLSESLPWLVANNRLEEADAVMRKAAKFNKITLPPTIFKHSPTPVKTWKALEIGRVSIDTKDATLTEVPNNKAKLMQDGRSTDDYKCVDEGDNHKSPEEVKMLKVPINGIDVKVNENGDDDQVKMARYGLREVFRSRTLLLYSIVLVFMWFVLVLNYNAMSNMVTYLPGNRYLNFCLYAIMEIPAYLLTWLLAVRASRRFSLMALCMGGGLMLLAATFTDTYGITTHCDHNCMASANSVTSVVAEKGSCHSSPSLLGILRVQ